MQGSILRLALAAGLLALQAGAASAACRNIQFERGASSAVVRGMAPAEGFDCLRFGAGNGQDVQVSVKSAHDAVAFGIEGIVDNNDRVRFRSVKKTYELRVHQTMRAVTPVPYELSLAIR